MPNLKHIVAEALARGPLTGAAMRAYRDRQRRRDWTRENRITCGKTSIRFFTNIGLGDLMIVTQFLEEFARYCREVGDPKLGTIVITAGAWPLEFRLPRGDFNLYWWWSMSGRDEWLDDYLAGVNVKPDAVCCLSDRCVEMATSKGAVGLKLPLAVGPRFRPMNEARHGVGFGGSKGHKDRTQVDVVVTPFVGRDDFEWVDSLRSPDDLCRFYNRKQIVLGMTEAYQAKVGMVNNRVFEVLATDTPFIVYNHWNLNATLGFDFPYQTSTSAQTLALAADVLQDYARHQDVFREFGRRVRAEHSWENRVRRMVSHLSGDRGERR